MGAKSYNHYWNAHFLCMHMCLWVNFIFSICSKFKMTELVQCHYFIANYCRVGQWFPSSPKLRSWMRHWIIVHSLSESLSCIFSHQSHMWPEIKYNSVQWSCPLFLYVSTWIWSLFFDIWVKNKWSCQTTLNPQTILIMFHCPKSPEQVLYGIITHR